MRVVEQIHVTGMSGTSGTSGTVPSGGTERSSREAADWAEQTRRVLTRDLLVRASRAPHGEGQALLFRALHLNLHLVAEIADRLELTGLERARTEHAALDGLLEAVQLFDPYGEAEFAGFAVPFVEWRIRVHLRTSEPLPTRKRPGSVLTVSRRTTRPTRR